MTVAEVIRQACRWADEEREGSGTASAVLDLTPRIRYGKRTRDYEPGCVCPRCASQRLPWSRRWDQAALDSVLGDLDIREPVEIRVGCPAIARGTDHESGGMTNYRNPGHLIFIHETLDREQAEWTLLHELRHCWQAEQFGREMIEDTAGRNASDGDDYHESKWEIDADNFATNHHGRYGLIRRS